MSKAIARVGDRVEGTCVGSYDSWEVVGHTGGEHSHAIYGWVTRHETGTFSGQIISGSNIAFESGRAIARVGDKVQINKSYSHSHHHDSINLITTISKGSSIMFDKGHAVAYVGCEIQGNGFKGKIVSGSNKIFVSK